MAGVAYAWMDEKPEQLRKGALANVCVMALALAAIPQADALLPIQAAPSTHAASNTSESDICHAGTVVTSSREGITRGLKNGTIDMMTANAAFGADESA